MKYLSHTDKGLCFCYEDHVVNAVEGRNVYVLQ